MRQALAGHLARKERPRAVDGGDRLKLSAHLGLGQFDCGGIRAVRARPPGGRRDPRLEPGDVRLATIGDLRPCLGDDPCEGALEVCFRLGHLPSISELHGPGPVIGRGLLLEVAAVVVGRRGVRDAVAGRVARTRCAISAPPEQEPRETGGDIRPQARS